MNGSVFTRKAEAVAPVADTKVQVALLFALLLASVLLSLLEPATNSRAWGASQVGLIEQDDPAYALPGAGQELESTLAMSEIRAIDGVAWLRASLQFEPGQTPIPPFALFLSGPFSAEVWWDGQLLGSKGKVGADAALEIPGPIDSVFYIPESLSAPGSHYLSIRLSSNHLGYSASGLFHEVSVGAFKSDPRRELRYYLLPLVLSGGFALLALQFARASASTGSRSMMVLTTVALLVLMQLASEVSRSLVAYSYDWHLARSLAIWIFATGAGLALNLFVYHRLGRAMINPWSLGTLVLAAGVAWTSSGFDNKTANALMVLSASTAVASLYGMRLPGRDLSVLATGTLALAWLVAGWIDGFVLLDRTIYFTTLVYLAMIWFWLSRGDETVEPTPITPGAAFFAVRHTGRVERIPVNDVLYVKAEGNFAELGLVNGKTVLHHQRLGQIMEKPPGQFTRVHRSWAINMAYLTGLRSAEGSRYFAQLKGGMEIPVSRFQARELRAWLAGD